MSYTYYAGTYCKRLQHTATHCNTLQHTATHCQNGQNVLLQMPLASLPGYSGILYSQIIKTLPACAILYICIILDCMSNTVLVSVFTSENNQHITDQYITLCKDEFRGV